MSYFRPLKEHLLKDSTSAVNQSFTSYQIKLLVCLGVLLFTIVLDFMLLPALSAVVLPALKLSTAQFGYVISAYSFSAGASALLFAAFADHFERKKLLLTLYSGFLLGILASALAPGFWALLLARVLTGIFGGVIAAISFSIVSEVFLLSQKGRAMGVLHMAFAFTQVLGLPLAVYIATTNSWQLAYFIIFGVGLIALSLSLIVLRPLFNHLEKKERAWQHIGNSVKNRAYWLVFSNNALLVTGDVLFMTFASAYFVGNQAVTKDQLAIVFGASGLATLLFSLLIGRLADKTSHTKVFTAGTVLAILMVATLSGLHNAGLLWVVILNTLLFIGIAARMICSGALGLEMPRPKDRGAFTSFDSALQLLFAGIAATAAGWLVYTSAAGLVHNYPLLAAVVIACMLTTVLLTRQISKSLAKREKVE
jgi:predicted MFS family arabinose efflux permease